MGRHHRTFVQSPAVVSIIPGVQGVRTMTSLGGDSGRSPGHYALFEAIRYKRHRQALLLTEAGVDVNCRNERGQTPLIYTSITVDDHRSRSKLVRLFLEAGADPNLTDWQGLTALMHASVLGQMEVVKPLLDCEHTDPGIRDPEGNTALMYASSIGHPDILLAFINVFRHDIKSLHLGQRNNQGFTALHLAARNGHDFCARLLTREAQLFPNAIEQFPDPRDLEREPTPCDNKLPNADSGQAPRSAPFEITISPDNQDAKSRTDKSRVPEEGFPSAGRVPNWGSSEVSAQTDEDFEKRKSLPEQSSIAVPSPSQDLTKLSSTLKLCTTFLNGFSSSTHIKSPSDFKGLPNSGMDMWPVLPSRTPVSKCSKVLEPLNNMEVGQNKQNNFVNKIITDNSRKLRSGQENRLSDDFGEQTSDSKHEVKDKDFRYPNHERDVSSHVWLSKREQRGNCISLGGKNENLGNLLPLISSGKESSPLPPVKSTLNPCTAKKNIVYASEPSLLNVRVEFPPGDLEAFKKNVIVRS